MKKNLYIVMAGIAMCSMVASCDNSDGVIEPMKKSLSATASIDDDGQTRTAYVDQGSGKALKVNWDTNETFNAYYAGGATPLVFTKTDGNAFVATDVPEGVTASTSFTGVYGNKVTYNPSTNKYTVDYSGQDGSLENLAKYDAMVASSTTDGDGLHFPFKHLSAFLRVTLKRGNSTAGTTAGLQNFSITFQSCKLNDENMTESGWIETGSKSFTVSFRLNTPLSLNEQRVIYLAIPPLVGENTQYSNVPFASEGYHKTVTVYSANNNKTFAAGKVYETTIDYYNGDSGDEEIAPPPPPRN